MFTRTVSLLAALILVFALVGCAASPNTGTDTGSTPPAGGDSTSGLRLAPGLYDLEDGTINAVGTLEYRDLEGGLWAIIGGTESEGNLGEVVAVVANPNEFEAQLQELDGKTVFVTGTRFEGTSVRMAGPEVTVTSIEEITDTPGIAE